MTNPANARAFAAFFREMMPTKSVVFLEGKTDSEALVQCFDSGTVKFGYVKGRPNVLRAIEGTTGLPAVGAIVDADADRVLGTEFPDNVFLTDFWDIEAFALMCDGFVLAISLVVSESAMQRVGLASFDALRSLAIESAACFGAVRAVNTRDNFGIKFRDVDFKRGVAKAAKANNDISTSLAVDILARSGENRDRAWVKKRSLVEEAAEAVFTQQPHALMTHSEDLCDVLEGLINGLGLRKSNRAKDKANASHFRMVLYSHINRHVITDSQLVSRLQWWSREQPGDVVEVQLVA